MTTEKHVPWRQAARLMQGPKGAGGPLDIIDTGAWQGREPPARRWIVDGMVPEGHVTTVNGHGGIGKTILMLQLAIAAALGRDWLGFPTRPCRSIFISCEDEADEVWRRSAAILAHFDSEPGDLEGRFMPVDRTECLNAMMTWPNRWEPGETTPLHSAVMNAALEHGAELVIIDSRYDVYPGDQTDTPQVTQFMTALRCIASEIHGGIVLISHPSKDGLATGDGESGSVAWHNKARSRMLFRRADREKDGPFERVLECKKQNRAAEFEPIGLTWQDGAFVRYAAPSGIVATIERNRAERLFLECLGASMAQGRNVSDSVNASNYAPKLFARMPEGEGLSKRDLESAMHRLFSSDAIRMEQFGPPSRGWRRIVKATD